MTVAELAPILGLRIISGNNGLSGEVSGGYVSDLLSDVMGNAIEGQVWVTLQTHQNIIAVASLRDLAAVIIVKGHQPESSTIEKSNTENIPVLSTDLDTFTITGRLYELLK